MEPCRSALLILAITAAGAPPAWGQDVFSESLGPKTTYGAIAVAVDPRSPEVLFASSDADGLFASRDGGATWQAVWSQDGIDHVEIDPGNPDLLYAAGYDIIRSTDGGRTWHMVNDGPRGRVVDFLRVNPHLPGVVYAGLSSGGVPAIDRPRRGLAQDPGEERPEDALRRPAGLRDPLCRRTTNC